MSTIRGGFRACRFLIIFLLFSQAAEPADLSAHRHNERGIEYMEEGRFNEAREAFEEALAVAPNDAIIKANLAGAHFKLGEAAYNSDDLKGAIAHWAEALKLNPNIQGLADQLERAKKESTIEKAFRKKRTEKFVVKFEGDERHDLAWEVISILREAYHKVGRDLDFYPSEPLTVIMYTSDQFKEVTHTEDWAAGVYDGKIRVRLGDLRKAKDALSRTLFHEYTHAAVYAQSGANVPIWFNEGLAQFEEYGERLRDEERKATSRLVEENKIVPLNELDGLFQEKKDEARIRQAYLQARLVVKYMIFRYRFYRVRDILNYLKQGKSMDEAIKIVLHQDREEFERDWHKRLKWGEF